MTIHIYGYAEVEWKYGKSAWHDFFILLLSFNDHITMYDKYEIQKKPHFEFIVKEMIVCVFFSHALHNLMNRRNE